MASIKDFLPKESPVVTAIYEWHKRRGDAEAHRGYLGASEIGHHCERYLWYKFRGCCKEELTGRKYRLFQTGHRSEPRFVEELRGIGCEVHEVDSNGDQFAISDHGGHFSGHMDGCALGIPGAEKTWHVLEMKTHSNKNFTKLKKDHEVLKSFPSHYAQMQAPMHKTGMRRALYIAVNKDTDELYAERVHYDKVFCVELMEKARRIITSPKPPPRISDRPDWFQCGEKWCPARELCHGIGAVSLPLPSISCRQCCHSTAEMTGDAVWSCGRHERGLSHADQDRACDDHLILPGMMYGCTPNDSGLTTHGHTWVEFVKEDGELWRHGSGKGEFSTEELRKLPLGTLSSDSFVKHAKDTFGAKVDAVAPDNIIDRYPKEDVETVWEGAMCDLAEAFRSEFSEDPWEPKAVFKCIDFEAAELSNGEDEACVVIKWLKTATGEIRIGKE